MQGEIWLVTEMHLWILSLPRGSDHSAGAAAPWLSPWRPQSAAPRKAACICARCSMASMASGEVVASEDLPCQAHRPPYDEGWLWDPICSSFIE